MRGVTQAIGFVSILVAFGCGPNVRVRVEHTKQGYEVLLPHCDGPEPVQKYGFSVRKGSALLCAASHRHGSDYAAYYDDQFLERWVYGALPPGYYMAEGGEWSRENEALVCPSFEPGFEYSIFVHYFGQGFSIARFKIREDGSVKMLTRGCRKFLWF